MFMEEDAKALAVRVVVFHISFFQSRGINNTDVQQPMKQILFCVLFCCCLLSTTQTISYISVLLREIHPEVENHGGILGSMKVE